MGIRRRRGADGPDRADPGTREPSSQVARRVVTTELPTWDIDTLVEGRGEAAVAELLEQARRRARKLAESKEKVASFTGADLGAFMSELGVIKELVGRAASYARLAFSADTSDESAGALLQKTEEAATEIATMLLFFELEWNELDDATAEKLLSHPTVDQARHHLKVLRRYRAHLLSEPEERILAEKSVTSVTAWQRLFTDLTAAIEVELDGRNATLEEALARQLHHDREVRQASAAAITAALRPGLRTRAFIHNMLALDKATEDRLRSYPHWLASFNLSQEASDEAVEALVGAVCDRYDVVHRWYALKARVLGLDKLAFYDRNAAVTADDAEMEWAEAASVVRDCYESFSPQLGSLVGRFFDERWIDVPPRPGKTPGAFCAPTVASHHPYVLLNYTGRRRDALTLAHELGHGVHQALGASQGPFHHSTPLTVAETASVFGETIVFNRLLEMSESPTSRFALLAEKVEGAIATVFRQVAMNRFEAKVHNARRNDGELSIDRFGDLWIETQSEQLGASVNLDEDYRTWWSYIPHFVHVPGYVYAYAFGQLLALSIYGIYEERGPEFVPSYIEMLQAGGSRSPEELARMVDCDLTDPSFWDGGLRIIERDVSLAEEAARKAG
ncbi:MAG: M3 family oligoendopeptidase, partial [Actinobacteria bacterium]|nr:M3 family oligoendopeptidase [Actinomycetota bacterium]